MRPQLKVLVIAASFPTACLARPRRQAPLPVFGDPGATTVEDSVGRAATIPFTITTSCP
jgi:hypothetical protein